VHLPSDLTDIGVKLDAPITLAPDLIAEIHADALATAGTLFGRPGVIIDGEPLV